MLHVRLPSVALAAPTQAYARPVLLHSQQLLTERLRSHNAPAYQANTLTLLVSARLVRKIAQLALTAQENALHVVLDLLWMSLLLENALAIQTLKRLLTDSASH